VSYDLNYLANMSFSWSYNRSIFVSL